MSNSSERTKNSKTSQPATGDSLANNAAPADASKADLAAKADVSAQANPPANPSATVSPQISANPSSQQTAEAKTPVASPQDSPAAKPKTSTSQAATQNTASATSDASANSADSTSASKVSAPSVTTPSSVNASAVPSATAPTNVRTVAPSTPVASAASNASGAKSTQNMTNNDAPARPDDAKDVNFRTENIGKWASQQENPFEKQNRERQAELEQRRTAWHKYRPPIVVAACIVFAGLVTWGMVAVIMAMVNRPEYVPTIAGGSYEDITDYTEKLQQIQQENPDNPNIIQETVDKTLETADGEQYVNQVLLAQMAYYYDNITCDEVIGMKDKIDISKLSGERRVSYYNMLYSCYDFLGMKEEAREYSRLAVELSQLIRGDNTYANE